MRNSLAMRLTITVPLPQHRPQSVAAAAAVIFALYQYTCGIFTGQEDNAEASAVARVSRQHEAKKTRSPKDPKLRAVDESRPYLDR
jgi:hypothetical protein